jgi:hypothetical protein
MELVEDDLINVLSSYGLIKVFKVGIVTPAHVRTGDGARHKSKLVQRVFYVRWSSVLGVINSIEKDTVVRTDNRIGRIRCNNRIATNIITDLGASRVME